MFEQTEFFHQLSQMSPLFWVAFIPSFLAIYFLPSIVASFRNRQHLGKIFLANIPAGFSWIAWVALIVWAFTGKQKKSVEQTAT
ncbi:superinfection immunity protein [Rheinheimera baltica]|uniref:Superinfection immunity protein n=1 Tax=Rheinheimera baltica TaxID=67576 RepID=A0ABT9I0X1_9GAMM|nr:superinfection immunity protein [Rheinheimera baltica]MDP5137016.1 superinfection immunity protein [Rheinheimera baltica]MDP5144143.1 superinfection immunity protein [Rheinheimera baltica]